MIERLGGILRTENEYDAMQKITDLGGRLRKMDRLREYIECKMPGFIKIPKTHLVYSLTNKKNYNLD